MAWTRKKFFNFTFPVGKGLPWYIVVLNLAVYGALLGGTFAGPLGLALGPLIGAGIAVIYSAAVEIRRIFFPELTPEEQKIFDKISEVLEPYRLKRDPNKPSRSRVYSWDTALFFGGSVGAMIGLMLGGPIGAGIGAIIGSIVGIVHTVYVKQFEVSLDEMIKQIAKEQAKLPVESRALGAEALVKKLNSRAQLFDSNQVRRNYVELEKIEERAPASPSTHDIPLHFSAFLGAKTGSEISNIWGLEPKQSVLVPDQLEGTEGVPPDHWMGPMGTLIGSAMPWLMTRLMSESKKNEWIKNLLLIPHGLIWLLSLTTINLFENPEQQKSKGYQVWREAGMVIPIYARIFIGILLGITLGTLIFPGLGLIPGVILASLITVMSPYLFAAGRTQQTLLKKIGGSLVLAGSLTLILGFSGLVPFALPLLILPAAIVFIINGTALAERLTGNPNGAPKKGLELPFYARLLVGFLFGSLLSMALGAVVPGAGHALGFVLGVGAFTLAQPAIARFGSYIIEQLPEGRIKNFLNAVKTFMPGYKRLLLGGLAGGTLGAALTYLLKGSLIILAIGAPIPIVPLAGLGMLAAGFLIGAGVAFIWPYVKQLFVAPVESWAEHHANRVRPMENEVPVSGQQALQTPVVVHSNGASGAPGVRVGSAVPSSADERIPPHRDPAENFFLAGGPLSPVTEESQIPTGSPSAIDSLLSPQIPPAVPPLPIQVAAAAVTAVLSASVPAARVPSPDAKAAAVLARKGGAVFGGLASSCRADAKAQQPSEASASAAYKGPELEQEIIWHTADDPTPASAAEPEYNSFNQAAVF